MGGIVRPWIAIQIAEVLLFFKVDYLFLLYGNLEYRWIRWRRRRAGRWGY